MRCRWLGWAGVEIEHDDQRLVIDPLIQTGALYAALGEAAAGVQLPEVVQPHAERDALAGLLTHLHRDHADAFALTQALSESAPILLPAAEPVRGAADAAIKQATRELADTALEIRGVEMWETLQIGPFKVTALPAADGTGDPQLSWAIEADDQRIIHCGDTLFHGWWWRAALRAGPFDVAFLPINGAVVDFPWRQPASPLPAVMTPEHAIIAARSLGTNRAVPIHYDAFDLAPYYQSIPDARARFLAAAEGEAVIPQPLEPGATLELSR